MMRLLIRAAVLLIACSFGIGAHAKTYYIDAKQGSDTNGGTSRSKAWLSLAHVNAQQFEPGDKILLHAGDVWQGQLVPSTSGTEGRPIVFARYGKGTLPRIDGQGKVEDVVYLHNLQNIEVRDLELTNHGAGPEVRRGVHIFLENFGTAKHVVISGLYIHDVNGTNDRKDNGGIIFRTRGSVTPSRFDGLTIERNIIWRVDRSAIAADSSYAMRSHWFPSLHVLIQDNYVEDIGGDGIVPWATDRAIIEHNIARYCNRRAGSYNAGMWPWSTDNSIFQLNEAEFTQTTKDGEGFDSDFNSHNTLFQYNYSHDNVGGFMLICTPVKRNETENVGNTGTVIRDNVSRNDHHRIINLSGATDVRVEHNVFYLAPEEDVQVLLISKWDGWSKDATFEQNRIYVEGRASFGLEASRGEDGSYRIAPGWGPAQNIQMSGNSFYGPHAEAPEGTQEKVDRSKPVPPWPDDEPTFNPADPAKFSKYMRQHRKWIMHMLRMTLGTEIHLEA